jgi:hypothetical protein
MEQTQQATPARTIDVGGETYEVARFSQAIQQAVGIYNRFQTDLQEAQLEVVKTQAAMQAVGAQITEAVKIELAAQETAALEAVKAANDEPDEKINIPVLPKRKGNGKGSK